MEERVILELTKFKLQHQPIPCKDKKTIEMTRLEKGVNYI